MLAPAPSRLVRRAAERHRPDPVELEAPPSRRCASRSARPAAAARVPSPDATTATPVRARAPAARAPPDQTQVSPPPSPPVLPALRREAHRERRRILGRAQQALALADAHRRILVARGRRRIVRRGRVVDALPRGLRLVADEHLGARRGAGTAERAERAGRRVHGRDPARSHRNPFHWSSPRSLRRGHRRMRHATSGVDGGRSGADRALDGRMDIRSIGRRSAYLSIVLIESSPLAELPLLIESPPLMEPPSLLDPEPAHRTAVLHRTPPIESPSSIEPEPPIDPPPSSNPSRPSTAVLHRTPALLHHLHRARPGTVRPGTSSARRRTRREGRAATAGRDPATGERRPTATLLERDQRGDDAIHGMLITPSANSAAISAQQQPMHQAPCRCPSAARRAGRRARIRGGTERAAALVRQASLSGVSS